MSASNSKSKNAAPVVVLREQPSSVGRYLLLMLPAVLGSMLFHAGLVGLFIAFVMIPTGKAKGKLDANRPEVLNADPVDENKESFTAIDIDTAIQESTKDIQYDVNRKAEVSVPGSVNPNEIIGIDGGDKTEPLKNLPAPGGFGRGQGGAFETIAPGNTKSVGEIGGYGPRGVSLPGSFYGRSGASRKKAVIEGGGTDESEAAVAKGLQWVSSKQEKNGSWSLTFAGANRPVAGTAFGLLPFLGAGKTHKAADKNPYDKQILKGLNYLIKQQGKDGFWFDDKATHLTPNMYDHGLATIALCEAYGLSQDPMLRKPAQKAIDAIVKAQDGECGGWGYGRHGGTDVSITGWQLMALKSGQMAGLIVPARNIELAKKFLDAGNSDGGFGYQLNDPSKYRMAAVGLLCRQYIQNRGPSDELMQMGVKEFIQKRPPEKTPDVYYYYYATQVMHHFGGEAWDEWNKQMRDYLVKSQSEDGSWNRKGDPVAARTSNDLMITSLNILTLEVYYRYLPLYYRESGSSRNAAK